MDVSDHQQHRTPGPAGPPEHRFVDEADAATQELFAVGMTLESCARDLGEEMAARLHDAAGQIDRVINRLRRAALCRTATAPSEAPAAPAWREPMRGRHLRPKHHDVVDRLLDEARRAVEMCASDRPFPGYEIEVVDSVQSLHRAIVGLAEAMEAPLAFRPRGAASTA